MAEVALPLAIGIGAAAAAGGIMVGAIALASEDSDYKRDEPLVDFAVNYSTATIEPTNGGHLGITLRGRRGITVKALDPADLCYKAGLREGDWINTINGKTVGKHTEALTLLNFAVRCQMTITIGYMRPQTVQFGLRHHKVGDHLGVTLKAGPFGRGVLVARVDPNGLVAQSGIQEGDIIKEVDGERVFEHKEALKLMLKRGLFKSKDTAVPKTITFMSGSMHPGKSETKEPSYAAPSVVPVPVAVPVVVKESSPPGATEDPSANGVPPYVTPSGPMLEEDADPVASSSVASSPVADHAPRSD